MTLFSHRKGIRPLRKAIQREFVDEELRNSLWNALKTCVFDHWKFGRNPLGLIDPDSLEINRLVEMYWQYYFKWPVDTIPEFDSNRQESVYNIVREYFFKEEWWKCYDFLEFTIKAVPQEWAKQLKVLANSKLETENAAYRIVGNEIVEITSEIEITEIESAIDLGFKSISSHLSTSLQLISDKQNPDYRNASKEAISAVEAVCKLISGDDKATLGIALKRIDSTQPLHPPFKAALSKLYGYTNDSNGIRHSLTEEDTNPSYADAKFLLVSSSAFVNYLLTKSAENGINPAKKP